MQIIKANPGMNANALQALEIIKYHRHLLRFDGGVTMEQACRGWVHRYAALWRKHFTDRRVA